MEGKIAEPKTFSLEGGFKAKEKGSTSIGKKNAMAGLSSSKVDKSGSSASVSMQMSSQKICFRFPDHVACRW